MRVVFLLLATLVVGVIGFISMPSQSPLSRTSVHGLGLRHQHHHSVSDYDRGQPEYFRHIIT